MLSHFKDFLRRVTDHTRVDIPELHARFNVGDYCPDCPLFEGIYEFCMLSAGGSIGAAKKLLNGQADIAIKYTCSF